MLVTVVPDISQVLRFYAFFQETVTERADENSRKRHIIIMHEIRG